MNPAVPVEQSVETLEVDVVAALLFADQRPLTGAIGLLDWRLDGELTRQVQAGVLRGVRGEKLLLRAGDKMRCDWVLVLGGGERRGCGGALLNSAVKEMQESCRRAGFRSLALALPSGVVSMGELGEMLDGTEQSAVSLVFIDDEAMA